MVLSVTVIEDKSFINVWLLERICGISLTIGFNKLSIKAEMFDVGLLRWDTIGLTLIGSL